MVAVFRLPANRGAKPWVKEHLNRTRAIRNVNGNDGLCVFTALSYLTLPPEDNPTLKYHSRVAEAKRLYRAFYKRDDWNNYRGFNIAVELEKFANFFEVNVNIYEWDGQNYYLADSLRPNNDFTNFDILEI
jgi:hypothetical protein